MYVSYALAVVYVHNFTYLTGFNRFLISMFTAFFMLQHWRTPGAFVEKSSIRPPPYTHVATNRSPLSATFLISIHFFQQLYRILRGNLSSLKFLCDFKSLLIYKQKE